jgi:hypothetical protein
MKKPLLIIAIHLSLFLSGCSNIGVQYKQPTEREDSASISASNHVFIHTFNEKGCYTGKTEIGESMKIHTDQEEFFAYEESFLGTYCRILFSFTPEKDSFYKIVAGKSGSVCSALTLKIDGEKSTPVKTIQHKLKTGFACIKFVPLR